MNSLDSDSDDSEFLFMVHKRKVKKDVTSKSKKARLNQHNSCNAGDTTAIQKEEKQDIETLKSRPHGNDLATNVGKYDFEVDATFNSAPTTLRQNEKQNESESHEAGSVVSPKLTNFFYSCPLCLRNFESKNTHVSHMKKCAKKSNMTSKQLLDALELHEKQLQERLAMGLSNPTKKKKKYLQTQFQKDSDSCYELALALALSKSLTDNCQNNQTDNNESKIAVTSAATNITTLEKFGFTSSSGRYGERKRSKRSKEGPSALRERSQEDRDKLITEKAAVILLDEDNERDKTKDLLELHNCKYAEQSKGKESFLWGLGENEDGTKWYAEQIKRAILDEPITRAQNVLQIVRDDAEDNIDDAIAGLNLPRMSIFEDWRKLINNQHFSDITLHTADCKKVFLHSIVLYARCPTILDLDLKHVLSRYNSITVLSFLKYLYCGVLDGLAQTQVDNLFHLAKFVNYQELLQVLDGLKRKLVKESGCETDGRHGPSATPLMSANNAECVASKSMTNDSPRIHVEERCKTTSTPLDNDNSDGNSILLTTIRLQSGTDILNGDSVQSLSSCTNGNRELIEVSCQNHRTRFSKIEPENSRPEEKTGCNEVNSRNVFEGTKNESERSIEPEGFLNASQLPGKKGKNCQWSSSFQAEDLERDMFEQMETSFADHKNNYKMESSRISNSSVNKEAEDNENRDISILYDSRRDRVGDESGEKKLRDKDEVNEMSEFEIPIFDPYEHFNSEILFPDSPIVTEEVSQSQSLLIGEASPLKSVSEGRSTFRDTNECIYSPELERSTAFSPSEAPECFSTPISQRPLPSASFHVDTSVKKSERARKTRKRVTPCTKIRKSSVRRSLKSKLTKSKCEKKNRSLKSNLFMDLEESEKVATILTESVLRELSNSNMTSPEPTRSDCENSVIEVTPPASSAADYTDVVTPLPDYSVMGTSSMKKHLTKYGIKKSLCKSKAKKILRHIYEELHPIFNSKNGKIVKNVRSKEGRSKKGGKIKVNRDGGEKYKNVKTLTLTEKSKTRSGVHKGRSKISDKRKPLQSPVHESPTLKKSQDEDDEDDSFTSSDSFDRPSEDNSEGSAFEVEEPRRQSGFASAADAKTFIFDFIRNDPNIRRQILIYEPIWLEDLKKKLVEKYNKKFKLSDVMDILDAQCITFRCERQRKTNRRRKKVKATKKEAQN